MSVKQLDLEHIFERLFALAAASSTSPNNVIPDFLRDAKHHWEFELSRDTSHRAATSYTLEETVKTFNLRYKDEIECDGRSSLFHWKVELMPEIENSEPSHCLRSSLDDYIRNYVRSSETACRLALELIMAYSLAELKGRDDLSLTATPKHLDNVKAFCEISFTHQINNAPNVIVRGRIDLGVGIVVMPPNEPNQGFHSLMLCVEAKIKGNLETAYGQLVTYLACLRESRINRGKHDSSVCGAATDGLKYVFVSITHEGVLRFSKQFDAMKGDLPIILGCLRYILEKCIAMSSYSSPRAGVAPLEYHGFDTNDIDDGFMPDDTPYLEGYGPYGVQCPSQCCTGQ